MSKIETLVKDNEHIYPRTVEKAIYDDNGVRLDNKINQLTTDVNSKCNANLISDAYSSSKTYSVGEFCIYNNALYKCIAQCQGVLPIDSNYFVQTSVGKEIGSSYEIKTLTGQISNNGCFVSNISYDDYDVLSATTDSKWMCIPYISDSSWAFFVRSAVTSSFVNISTGENVTIRAICRKKF